MAEMTSIVTGLLNIHKIITRGLTVSIQKCDEYLGSQGMTPAESEGLSMYASTLRWIIHSHHLTEDELVYPYFKNRIEAPYARLGNDHQAVTAILASLEKSLPLISTDRVVVLRRLLDELNTIWVPHIKIEEESFTEEKVNAIMGREEQENLGEKFSQHGRLNSGPAPLSVPFMFYNLGGNDREDFLKMFPWIVKKVLVPIVWQGKWKPMKPLLLG